MHPPVTHRVVLFIWTAGWSTAVLFAWLTLSNALSLRAGGLVHAATTFGSLD